MDYCGQKPSKKDISKYHMALPNTIDDILLSGYYLTTYCKENRIYSYNHGGHVALCRMYIILVVDFANSAGATGRGIANDRMQIWYPAKSLLRYHQHASILLRDKGGFYYAKE